MRIVILGPPGSGKSTHAQALADARSAVHLSVGALLRAEVAAGSSLGHSVAERVSSGELVSPDDVLAVLKQPMDSASASGGWVLDGAPRTVEQAAVLDAWLASRDALVDVVIALDVPDPVLRQRLSERARADDTPEVVERRIATWAREAPPLLDWYASRLKVVDGVGAIPDVRERVFDAVREVAVPEGTR